MAQLFGLMTATVFLEESTFGSESIVPHLVGACGVCCKQPGTEFTFEEIAQI
jgi:hypothetical protein